MFFQVKLETNNLSPFYPLLCIREAERSLTDATVRALLSDGYDDFCDPSVEEWVLLDRTPLLEGLPPVDNTEGCLLREMTFRGLWQARV